MARDDEPSKKQKKEKRGGRASPLPDVTRRGFLKATGLAFSAGALPPTLSGCEPSAGGEGGGVGPADAALSLPDFTADLTRPDDMVVLSVGFINLQHDVTGKKLVRINAAAASYFIVTFPPQHLFEEAFEFLHPEKAESPPVAALLSGPSRVVLKLPTGTNEVAYTSAALLATFSKCDMNLAASASYTPLFGRSPEEEAEREPVSALDAGRRRRLAKRQGAVGRGGGSRGFAAPAATSPPTPTGTTTAPPPIPLPLPVPLTKPAPDVTALELPFRLLLSPRPGSAWAHEAAPFSSPATGRTELWHTRLGARALDGAGQPIVKEVPGSTRPMRAIWTRDPGFDPSDPTKVLPTPFLNSPTSVTLVDFAKKTLIEKDRADIVHQSSNYAELTDVLPLTAKQVMLTSLGGWLDVRGAWGFNSTTGLMKWEHRATQGRDHYVRIERAYFADTRHEMILVELSERIIKPEKPFTAYLWKRTFVRCRNPIVSFPDPTSTPSVKNAASRRMPFRTIELKTLVSPNLDPMPSTLDPHFIPCVDGGTPLLFEFEGTDWEGNVWPFRKPIVMMKAEGGIVSEGVAQDARDDLDALGFQTKFYGQRIALAPATVGDPTKVEDTVYEVSTMRFAMKVDKANIDAKVPFLPIIAEAKVVIEAVRHLSEGGGAQTVTFPDVYANNGFGGANVGEVLLDLGAGQTMSFANSSERSGGFLTPDMQIRGISRKTGPVGGNLDTVAGGTFQPSEFFGALGSAKLFGTFPLQDVLGAFGLDLDKAPKFITQALDDAAALLVDLSKVIKALGELGQNPGDIKTLAQDIYGKLSSGDLDGVEGLVSGFIAALGDLPGQLNALPLPDGPRRALLKQAELLRSSLDGALGTILDLFEAYHKAEELAKNLTVNLEWRTPLANVPSTDPIFEPDASGGGLLLGVEVRGKATATKPAGVDLLCSLEKFNINLIAPANFIQLRFEKLQFRIANNKKPDLDVVFGGITFVGPLSFVEKLKEIIPLDGFSDPPNLDITPEGIAANFSLPIPAVAVGVFSLENISVGAGFKVPFIGANPLSVSFFFCTREAPFTLTVCMLGGGGFFGIELTTNGVHLIEAALEFGASLSIDLGVASGGVSIMAGIYFKWEDGAVELTGYLRIRGEVDVLGLIRASIELYLEFQYLAVPGKAGKVWGRATIEIEVEIFFLSFTVSATAEKRFSGSNEDPTFADVMGPCDPLLEPACDPTYSPWNEYVEAYA